VVVPAGLLAFAATVYLLWRAANRPPGPEQNLLTMLRRSLQLPARGVDA
jgi:hypothetical protein